MICKPCRDGIHELCPEAARQVEAAWTADGMPPLGPVQRAGGQKCDCLHKARKAGASAGSVRGATANGPSPMMMPATHWWFDCDQWVGAR